MRSKATKNTRAANSKEKQYHAFLKWEPCQICGAAAPSDVDHVAGKSCRNSTGEYFKVLIGHFMCQSLCRICHDDKKLISTIEEDVKRVLAQIAKSPVDAPEDVLACIAAYKGKGHVA